MEETHDVLLYNLLEFRHKLMVT
ncbi:hypothetical protein P9D31_14710 [Bacillus haynesii]|nr:hypothetical protein [Bacillus haynesii]MCY7779617.1 hypothetical protein [Bacillus haynesii]MCY8371967.1 hypothetical protein [Bacillus haynesii]MCY8672582.1 hypothetical protein [Bacillus haynesii]MEC1473583.1 hypothetical protein [Bacillus haynesii]MEC1478336.1 hypothetical protein [Bacillus haynesii]